jgi:hypothetical protein
MATLFFGTAQMAVGFSHYGYNNVQVYLVVGPALGVLAWARRRQSVCGYYLAGAIAGLGFYTYYTARVVCLLLFLLIWSCDGPPLARKMRARSAALALGLGLTILPIFSTLGTVLRNMLRLAMSGDQATTLAAALSRMLTHWLVSIVHGLWYPGPHHFQANPINDPISGTLAVIGFWLCLGGWRRGNGRFLAVAYLLSTFLIGATSPHFRPPLTRLLFLSPLTAILAAVGADRLLHSLPGGSNARRRVPHLAAGGLVTASMIWNIYTVEYNVRYEHHGYGNGTTSELVRMAQQLPTQCRIIFIQVTESQEGLVGEVLDEYGLQSRLIYTRKLDADAIRELHTTPPPFVVFADIADPQRMGQLEAAMAQRFPTGTWRSSDAGRQWNLRYMDVCTTDLAPPS